MRRPSAVIGRALRRDRSLAGTTLAGAAFAFCGPMLALLILLTQNSSRVAEPSAILRVGVVAGLVTAGVALVLGRFVANWPAAVFCGVGGYAFFSASWLPADAVVGRVAIWLFVSALASTVVAWLVGSSSRMFRFAALAMVMLTAGLAAGAVGRGDPEVRPTALSFVEPLERTPNIYMLVLDGFGRVDVLEEQFDDVGVRLDVGDSIRALEDLGFRVEERSTTNYMKTNLSVPSTLNAEYHVTPDSPLTFDERWDYANLALRGDNELVRFLRAAGYEYWHSASGLWDHAPCDNRIAVRCLGPDATAAEAINAVWDATPIAPLMDDGHSETQDPERLVDEILAIRDAEPAEPYFVFAHIMSPHHPYRLASDCSPAPENPSSLRSGSDPAYRGLYIAQVNCVARQLERSMTRLVAEDPDAMILVQADHGSAFSLDLNDGLEWSEEQIAERFSTFRLTRLPADCRSESVAAQSLINTVPVVEGCLRAESVELIEPRWFITGFHYDERVREFDYTEQFDTEG